MDYNLESFINFCDDYEISEEANFKKTMKSVWITIKNIFKKIILFLKNIIRNLYYLKTAFLPAQMSEDIQLVSQNCTPRFEAYNRVFYSIIKLNSMGVPLDDGEEADIFDMTDQSLDDAESIINDVKNSDEYRRITTNDYDQNTVTEVPLSNVIPTVKSSEKNAQKYQKFLDKIDLMDETNMTQKLHSLFGKLIQLYQIQQSVLTIFLQHAKMTASSLVKNIKDKKDGSVQTNRKSPSLFKAVGTSMKSMINPHVKSYDDYKKIVEQVKIVTSCNNDLNRYGEYKKAYDALCDILHLKKGCILVIPEIPDILDGTSTMESFNHNKITVLSAKPKQINILHNIVLYHTSNDPNLKELTGRYMYYNGNEVARLFPTPRIYFSVGTATARDGSKFNGIDPTAIGGALYKYKTVKPITKCYRDPEFFGTGSAVYVEINGSLKVTKLE